ncbi:anti-repressor SinI family protein [Heyndrickxia acidiproducens]|nr:anti-repressor SinI family protein [Heyndrickxia acidiproducens]
MGENIHHSNKPLDKEWVDLISLAKEKGLTVSEVQSFLRKKDSANYRA